MLRNAQRQRIVFWTFLCCGTVLLFLIVRGMFFQTFYIVSDSMLPSLYTGDRVLVYRAAYVNPVSKTVTEPRRGDVVVFSRFSEFQQQIPGRHYIKRIVGVPGDTVAVAEGQVLRGEAVAKAGELDYGPVTLQTGQFFVAGDNESSSKDSRFFGPISLNDIEGRALLVFWSVDSRFGRSQIRWSRVGTLL